VNDIKKEPCTEQGGVLFGKTSKRRERTENRQVFNEAGEMDVSLQRMEARGESIRPDRIT
jgi:hypothetical protein